MQVANSCSAIQHTGNLYLGEFLQANWTTDLCPQSASFQAAVFTFGSVLKINNEEAVTTQHITSFTSPLRTCIHSQYLFLFKSINILMVNTSAFHKLSTEKVQQQKGKDALITHG